MEQANRLCGGVSLLHTVVDGKHHYEVKNVLTDIRRKFVRKGDKILMINGVKTKDLPPEKFASMLSSGAPILTIHEASINTDINECLESDAMRPYRKEKITLHFRMAMVREESLEGEENGVDPAVCEWESDYTENDQEMLLVSMNETSVAVLSGRGCDPENPCNNCGSHECNLSEVVVAAQMCEVTSVARQYIKKFGEQKHWISLVRSNPDHTSLSAEITIYYYISNILPDLGRGVPVVLNFTDSNNFLNCTCEDGKVVLKIECCGDKSQLKKICKDDEETWPFVFYMTTAKDSTQHFESAAHRGWFIQTKQANIPVDMENRPEQMKKSFHFLIYFNSRT
uniref:Interleukin-1 n=1 Tax=Pygocentrus nattereri TaxID=42514 RepID=A0AAR2LBV8_PYGNA